MANKIITISREFGSGGRFIGEEVAKKLGMKYYDKDIISQIAEKLGFSKEYISQNAELSPKKGLFAYALTGRDTTGKSVEDMVYEAQRKVILEIAENELRFFVSVLVPNSEAPTSRTERFTSARIEPSFNLQSDAPRYWMV